PRPSRTSRSTFVSAVIGAAMNAVFFPFFPLRSLSARSRCAVVRVIGPPPEGALIIATPAPERARFPPPMPQCNPSSSLTSCLVRSEGGGWVRGASDWQTGRARVGGRGRLPPLEEGRTVSSRAAQREETASFEGITVPRHAHFKWRGGGASGG